VDPSNRSNNAPPVVGQANGSGSSGADNLSGNKRLHVSNIPFRFREPDLRDLFSVSYSTMFTLLNFLFRDMEQ